MRHGLPNRNRVLRDSAENRRGLGPQTAYCRLLEGERNSVAASVSDSGSYARAAQSGSCERRCMSDLKAFALPEVGSPVDRDASIRRQKAMERRRSKAKKAVSAAKALGIIPPASELKCFDCGSEAECYDHRDYRKPTHIWPVCAKCDAKRGAGSPYVGGDISWARRMRETKNRLAGIPAPIIIKTLPKRRRK